MIPVHMKLSPEVKEKLARYPRAWWNKNSREDDPLPDRLSDLLEVAVDDVEDVQRDPKYVLNMLVYHETAPRGYQPCLVCMAGAVMARTLGCHEKTTAFPSSYSDNVRRKLESINVLSQGSIRVSDGVSHGAFGAPGRTVERSLLSCMQPIRDSYSLAFRRAPWSAYREAIARLRECGL